MNRRRKTQLISALALNPYFLYFFSRVTYKGYLKGICVPGLNCYACPLTLFSCPIGGLQHSFALLSPRDRMYPGRFFGSMIYILGSLGLVGGVVGRMPCGWFCPFGLLQELLYKVPTPKLRLPRGIKWGRYASLLLLVIIIPLVTASSWFSRLCPMGALEGGVVLKLYPPKTPLPEAGWFFWFKMALLGAFLLWFMFSRRPFCRSICPLGAVLGLFNRVSLYRMAVDDSSCNRCGKCREVCPVDINIFEDPNSPDCIRCLECKNACPTGAVASGFRDIPRGFRTRRLT
jgi:polyferredoxin